MDCPFTKQATEAFLVFDQENTETLDVREVGTVIRSLGTYVNYSFIFINLCVHINT